MTEVERNPFAIMRLIDERQPLLRQIEREPTSKPALVESVGWSRSTVDRAVDQLHRYHLVERTGDGYVLTFPARRLLDIYDRYHTETERITSRAGLLSTLPAECTLPDELLWHGRLIEGDGVEPEKPQHVLRRIIEDADHLTLSYPVFDSYPLASLVDRLVADRPTELLVDSPCFEFLSKTATNSLGRLCEDGVFVLDEDSLEYGIVYSESNFAVIFRNSHRQCRGLLYADNEGRSWAEKTYQHQRTRAQRVTDPDSITRSSSKHDMYSFTR